MMQLQAEAKSLTLDADIAADVGEIIADRRAVQQMLINLISNAIKFTPAGGTVTVGAQPARLAPAFLGQRYRHRHQRRGSGRLGKPFTQVRNDYTRELSKAPGSACRWSRDWSRCTTAR